MEPRYFIKTRHMPEPFPVSEEEFKTFARETDAFRRRQQRRGRCVCPAKEQLLCDQDCLLCPHYVEPDGVRLDAPVTDEDGAETARIDLIADDSTPMEDIAADSVELSVLFARLSELMPEALEIGRLRMIGLSDEKIAEQIGIKRRTFAYRLNKAKEKLAEEFPDWI